MHISPVELDNSCSLATGFPIVFLHLDGGGIFGIPCGLARKVIHYISNKILKRGHVPQ